MTLQANKPGEQEASPAAFRKSQQWLRALLAHSYDAIVLTGSDGTTLFASPSIEHVLGYSPEEYMALNRTESIHPDYLAQGIAFFRDLLQHPSVTFPPQHTRFRHQDGSWRWIEYTATNLLTDLAVGAIVFNFRDITERKEVEANQYLLAAIVSSSDDAIVSKTLDGIITSWNVAAEKMFGYNAQEAIGQHITLIIPEKLHHEEEVIIQKLRKGERIEHFDTIRQRKDGTTLAVSLSISPVKDKQGKIIGAAKIARDISERKQLEDELRRSKQQLVVIFENIADGIIVYNPDNQIIYANETAAHMNGFSSVQAMLDMPPYTIATQFELFDEHEAPFPLSQLPHRRVLAGEQKAEAIIGYRKSSTTYAMQWSISKARPVFDAQGKLLLVITILHDMTERMLAERRKDEFISMASHELKTPVTSMKGFGYVLERRLRKQGDEQALLFLDKMDRQLNRLSALISELLDISRMQSGKLAFQQEAFDLSALVKETVENIQQTTQTHNLCLEEAAPAQVVGDRDRIGQVLINLITNAIKYSPQGDTVKLRVSIDADQAVVSVQDFGIGIDQQHHDKIFERFYQVTDPEDRTYPGLGIGLYICSEIMRRHRGRIWVQSSKGQGATFYMSLPLAADAQRSSN
jgi:PAS domain S-box-containing protein